jgi:ATP-dependent Clp protease ATP-binding subunit ClpA
VLSGLTTGLPEAEKELAGFVHDHAEPADDDSGRLEMSFQLHQLFEYTDEQVQSAEAEHVEVPHVIHALFLLEESYAAFWLRRLLPVSDGEFISILNEAYDSDRDNPAGENDPNQKAWMLYCRPLAVEDGWKLVGREKEISRALLILCRKEKCNPVFVGEHGVGKTAIVRGLAALLAEGKVPKRLQGKRLYTLDFSAVMSGTQFRGAFESRMKEILDGVAAEGDVILFIDNIHEIVGAGRTGESMSDATSLLVPYIERRAIAFVGATTFEDYKKSVNRSKNLERMFRRIEVEEPDQEEAVRILEGLRGQFESFHGVRYADDVIRYAVEGSARYVHGRFLPEKAVDLLDESGAWLEMHPAPDGKQVVTK